MFGALDVEWVHFVWNAAMLLAVVFLLRHYLETSAWSALILAGWHQVDHTHHVGVPQDATDGYAWAAGGQRGVGRGPRPSPSSPPLLYNVLETTPLVLDFHTRWANSAGHARRRS